MKYHPEDYADAFIEAVSKNKEHAGKMIESLLSLVRKNGDTGNIKKIYRFIAARGARSEGGHEISVESARELPKELTHKIMENFSERDFVENSVRPELAAGVRILIDGERELDFTLARKLKKLFS